MNDLQLEFVASCRHVGSRVTCIPPPENGDYDYLAYVFTQNWIDFDNYMIATGWTIGGSRPEHADAAYFENGFCSYKKGELNVDYETDNMDQAFELAERSWVEPAGYMVGTLAIGLAR